MTTNLNQNQEAESARLLLIDKPLRWTSFDVVKKLKYAGKFKKIGHAGTLDPLATGLLILCTGKMTKKIDEYQAQTKEYTGKFVFGKTTPCIDLEQDFNAEYPIEHIDNELIEKARLQLTGNIEQVPPMFSAVKVDGKKLYELARKGKEIEVKTRPVIIHDFEIDVSAFPQISFKIVCSKGTYVRSLVRDFGQLCNSGAYLAELRRTKIGDFNVDNAMTIDNFVAQCAAETLEVKDITN